MLFEPHKAAVCITAAAALFLLAACGASEEASTLKVTDLADQQEGVDFDRLSYELIPRDDLPPEGTRSLFDHMIKDAGALPYPFEEVIELVKGYDKDGAAPTMVLIPDGRSLLKGQASFHRPRVIAAADIQPPISDSELDIYFKGRLFMGFVEDASEIEVISYNEAAGRFEFQLVKDYREGGVPQITYARRAVCTTCHVGEAPIFPVRPWDETNANPQVAEGIAEATAEGYAGVPASVPLAQPERIDELTDVGNAIPVTQAMWIDGCGADEAGGKQCRSAMLREALRYIWNPSAYSTESENHQALLALQAKNWPSSGIEVPNNDLFSRNPFVDKPPGRGFGHFLLGLVGLADDDATIKRRGLVSDDVKLADFEKLPPLRKDLDPLTPRPAKAVHKADTSDAVFNIARLLTKADKKRIASAAGDLDTLLQAVDSDVVQAEMSAGPFRRTQVVQALLSSLGVEQLPVYCCSNTEGMSEPIIHGVEPLEITAGSVLEHYETYCFACHRGNPRADLDFMAGKTEEEVLAKIAETSEIKEALDYERYLGTEKASKLMPPAKSWQRAKLDKVRAGGEDPTPEMAEAVQSLFEF